MATKNLLSPSKSDRGTQMKYSFYDYPIWAQNFILIVLSLNGAFCYQLLYYMFRRKPIPPLRSRLPSLGLITALFSTALLMLEANLRSTSQQIATMQMQGFPHSAHSSRASFDDFLPMWAQNIMLTVACVFIVSCCHYLYYRLSDKPLPSLRSQLLLQIVVAVLVFAALIVLEWKI